MSIGNMLIMGKYKESMEMLIWTKLLLITKTPIAFICLIYPIFYFFCS